MPSKRKRATAGTEGQEEEERSPTPTSIVPVKRRKKSLLYDPTSEASTSALDPTEIIQRLYETVRNYKSEDGRLLCETFIRAPQRRTAADYYEVVTSPIDMIKIQRKIKTDEYEEIDQLTTDIDLMVNNSKAYYKKGTAEYKDACDLWDVYTETRDELLAETFGDSKPEKNSKPVEDVKEDEDEDEDDEDEEEDNDEEDNEEEETEESTTHQCDGNEDKSCDPEDFEHLFAAVVTAVEGEREISAAFHLLPTKSLYPQYYEVIKDPIDLKMIAQRVQDSLYKTMDDMEQDLNLMVKNAKTFNETKSLIFKDACTLKKVIETKRKELEYKKTAHVKMSERIRTRERVNSPHLSAVYAAMNYPEESVVAPSPSVSSAMEFEDDSGGETTMSEEENPLWTLFNCVKSYANSDGVKLIDPYMKLPNKRFYPDYYEEIKKPMSMFNVHKKVKRRQYQDLDDLATDLNLVFENAKRYNADESKIYKDAVTLQGFLWEKKKELERFGFKEMSIPELGIHFEFPMLKLTKDAYDEDSNSKLKAKKSLTITDSEKKRIQKKPTPEETLKKRLWALYKTVFEYTDANGRAVRQIFMFLPSKRDYPDYYKVITDPIDLSMIENKIKAEKYSSEQQLLTDFELMFQNARHYNEEGSLVYNDANTLERILKAKWKTMCQSPDLRKSLVKCGKTRSKSLPTLAAKLQDMYESVRDYQDSRGRTLSSPFMKLPLKSDYPDYYEVIKKAIDMQHIQQRMLTKRYESLEDMVADFVQMFDNACKYNEPDSLIYKDALTLQRLCLEKKMELSEDGSDGPDVRAMVLEMMTNLFITVYNYQDEEGRCYIDSFAEVPERDLDADPNDEKPIAFDHIKRNLDRGRYRRMDRFQEDMFKVFERARRLSRTDSQLYEDAVEMQMYFIKMRDELCKNGEILLTPALSYTERHLQAALDVEKQGKLPQEQREDEEKKKAGDAEESQDQSTGEGSENSMKYKDQTFHVGDFVHVEPREPSQDPHIMCIEKLFTDSAGNQMLYGNWFYRPNETFHLATRKFLEKEVFKSDYYTSIPPSQILTKCYVMYVKEYFKYKPEGIPDKDVYVCEFRYTARHKSFKKIKIWQVPKNEEVTIVDRELPLVPVRVASVFADKVKDDFDDGDTSILDKKRLDVLAEGPPSEEGLIYYEQIKIVSGTYKLGDCVYVKSDQEKPQIYRVDKIWVDRSGESCFFGPLFVRPSDIVHSPTRLFFKNELFVCGVEETRTMKDIISRCSVLHIKDFCCCRPTEIMEIDIFLCESKYHENEKSIKKLGKGLKKHTLSPRVTDDEMYFFKKPIVPQKEPSPLLLKASEESVYDGEESRDTLMDGMTESLNTSLEEAPAPVEKTPKRVASDEPRPHAPESSKKSKAKSTGRKTQISGYIVYSGEIRKAVQHEHPDCTFGEISRIVGGKGKTGRRLPSGYLIFSGIVRKQIQQENESHLKFGEISRLVGIKWRNLDKEEKEKYEEKAKRIAEEQQAKQDAAERAFNESLNKTQQQTQWTEPYSSGSGQQGRPSTPASQGYQPGFYQYNGAQSGQYPNMPVQAPSPGMHNGVAVPSPYMPRGPGASPGMTPLTGPQGQRPPFMPPYQPQAGMRQPTGPNMGPYQGMPQGQTPPISMGTQSPHSGTPFQGIPGSPNPYPGMTQGLHANLPTQSAQQVPGTTQQMAPPPPPPRPPSPMFVTVPQRTQRLLHSEAYLKYIEGLNSESRTVSDWDKNLLATQENTQTPDENRLPSHWLAQGAGYHGNVTNALWALRDLMLKDTLNIQRTLPFDALQSSVAVTSGQSN